MECDVKLALEAGEALAVGLDETQERPGWLPQRSGDGVVRTGIHAGLDKSVHNWTVVGLQDLSKVA
jgi:hypothetical protein